MSTLIPVQPYSNLNFLDQRGVQVTIHPIVTVYICTLLAWAKCFVATYGEYPSLYDLLGTQLHLHDSTFPRPLLPCSRGPPTLQNEPVASQAHLAPPTLPNHLYVCLHPCPSIITSVCHQVTSLSVILSVHLATSLSVDLSVHHVTSPSVNMSMIDSTHLSITQPVHPATSSSDSLSPSD